jgi:hypothetical protein
MQRKSEAEISYPEDLPEGLNGANWGRAGGEEDYELWLLERCRATTGEYEMWRASQT